MHNTSATGNNYFMCDFCRQSWSEDRPMIEGHKGSLICSHCLTVAYTELVCSEQGTTARSDEQCTLCLEVDRDDLHWRSPMFSDSLACKRCIKQAAGALHKDPDSQWQKPRDPSED